MTNPSTETTTREEWIAACAARFKERTDWLGDDGAREQAEACAEMQEEFYGEDRAKWDAPANAADEELLEWTNDEGAA